jgi:molybdopterin converting factor small subunit
MAIQVKLYGELKKKTNQANDDTSKPHTVKIVNEGINTVFDLLDKLGLEQSEISTIFVNGKYCGPGKKLKDGDRIGLFPRNMGLMFVEIAKNNPVYVLVKFFADLQKYGPAKKKIDVPEGSTINTILDKYRVPKDKIKMIILVNRKPCYDMDYVVKNEDTIAFFPPLAGG